MLVSPVQLMKDFFSLDLFLRRVHNRYDFVCGYWEQTVSRGRDETIWMYGISFLFRYIIAYTYLPLHYG